MLKMSIFKLLEAIPGIIKNKHITAKLKFNATPKSTNYEVNAFSCKSRG